MDKLIYLQREKDEVNFKFEELNRGPGELKKILDHSKKKRNGSGNF